MRKRNIRTLLYYTFLWMWAILTWKMENYMDRNYYCAPGNWIRPSQIELDGRTFISQLHWVGSAIQFVGCARLRTQFTHLRTELTVEAAEGLYCTGKMSDPGHSIGSGRLPGSLRTVWSGKMSVPGWTQLTHVGIQTDPGPLFSSFTGSVLHDSSIQFLVALSYRKRLLRNELRMN